MKILYLNQLYAPNIAGGSEICLQEEVEGMRGRGHEVVVLATGGEPGVREELVNGVRVLRAGTHNVYWHYSKEPRPSWKRRLWHINDSYNRGMAKIVDEVLAAERPDVIAIHTLPGWSAAVWDVIGRRELPILQVLHDLYHLCPNTQMFKGGHSCERRCFECRLLRLRSRKASESVTAVVGVSNFVLNRYLEEGFFPSAKIKTTIYNARSIVVEAVPTRVLASDGAVRIGFLGTISAAKGVELLLSAFSKVSGPAHLSIAGKGDSAYVKELVDRYAGKRIEFVGYVTPRNFFESIDVLVVPSIWNDTYPGVAVESCIYGVPVIGTRMGGVPEIIKDQISGLIFDPEKPESLLAALNTLISSPEKVRKMGEAARASSKSMTDTATWLDSYESLYGQIMEN